MDQQHWDLIGQYKQQQAEDGNGECSREGCAAFQDSGVGAISHTWISING